MQSAKVVPFIYIDILVCHSNLSSSKDAHFLCGKNKGSLTKLQRKSDRKNHIKKIIKELQKGNKSSYSKKRIINSQKLSLTIPNVKLFRMIDDNVNPKAISPNPN